MNPGRHDFLPTNLADDALMNLSWSRHLGKGILDFKQILQRSFQDSFSKKDLQFLKTLLFFRGDGIVPQLTGQFFTFRVQ